MYAVAATFTVDAGDADHFLTLVRKNARASRKTEPGCHQFDVCTDPDAPGTVFLYELYTDAAAFEAHKSTAHFHEFDAAAAPLVRAKEVRLFADVFQ